MENKGVLLQKYELGKLLGQGTFAKVHHARNITTGQSVAVKVIDKEKVLKVGLMEQIKREISVMRLVRHPNVVQLHEVLATKCKIYFVMEYVKGGELFNKIAKGRLKEDATRKYFQQLISAVDYCHSRGVYHRDLKPENLLVDENGDLKVSDFGLSALSESKRQDGLLHTTCGTPAYVAPEVINRKGYDGAKADIWSCGVILFVLMAGYLPFHDPNLMEMYKKIGKAEFKCPNWFPSEVRRLLSKILDPNPNTRISISKIMDSPWFRKGFEGRLRRNPAESKPTNQVDAEGVLSSIDTNISDLKLWKNGAEPKLTSSLDDSNGKESNFPEGKKDLSKLANLNAFDIISLSSGFDLSGLFEETANQSRKEARFTSRQSASTIISKLEDVAKKLRLKVRKKDGGVMKMEGSRQGRKGVLAIDAEIFEVTPSFHLVEMKKSSGDTLEYQKMWKNGMRPALKDIVWAWQGEKAEQEPESPPQLQQEVLLQA